MHEKIIQMVFLLAMEIFLILNAINFFLYNGTLNKNGYVGKSGTSGSLL